MLRTRDRGIRWRSAAVAVLIAAAVLLAGQPVGAQSVTLNPDGGNVAGDGLRIVFNGNTTQVYRAGKYQTWAGWIQPLLYVTDSTQGYCLSINVWCGATSSAPDQRTRFWTSEAVTKINDQEVQRIWAYDLDGVGMFKVTMDFHYVSPNNYIDLRMKVDAPDGYDGPLPLYLVVETALDSSDNGPGDDQLWWGKRTLVQYNATAVSGLRESGTPWDSALQGSYDCPFGFTSVCAMLTGNSRGPYFGEPYPTPTYVEANVVDAGVGAHWDLTNAESRTVTTQLFFSSFADWEANIGPDLNPNEASPWPEDYPPEPTPEPEPQATPLPDCTTLPDMAVSPERIELTAGGNAQIEVALRNLCPDRVFRGADLLVSLSDGISVGGGSAGLLNLGGRAAWQNLSLNPGETRRFTLDVTAPDAVPPGPQHITELYYAGRAAQRIDGVFITAAPAAVEPTAAPIVAEVPVTVEVPALPITLPNTAAGGALPLGLLTALGAAAAGAALAVRRRS
jgi:hypothetical protein